MVRTAVIFVAIAASVAIPFAIWGDSLIAFGTTEDGQPALARFGAYAWLAAIGLLVADIAIPVPTSAVMGALGIIYGPVTGGLIASAGSILAGLVGYAAARTLGRPAIRALFEDQALGDAERLFRRFGGWIVILSRWFPLLPEVVAVMAGLARMRFPVFLAALTCGSLPVAFTFAAIGHLGRDAPVTTLLICIVLPLLLWFAVHRSGALDPHR